MSATAFIGEEEELKIAPIPLDLKPIDLFYGIEGPTSKQEIFRDAEEKYKLFGGGVGGGKSRAGCAEGVRLSIMYPGNRGFMCRAESASFVRTTLVTLLAVIGQIEKLMGQKIILKHNKSDKEIYFINGSVILYGGLGGPEDMERIKSLEIGWYFVDEASESPLNVIEMLKARLRWKLPDGTSPKYFGMYASNPEPGWVKNQFVTPQLLGRPKKRHIFIQALLKDNPYVPEGYLEELTEDNPATWVKRYVDGSWDAVEGQIWSEFDILVHVFPNEASDLPIPHVSETPYQASAGLDHGSTNPTCLLASYIDESGNIFIYDEYYSKGLVSHHCTSIQGQFSVPEFSEILADPSMMRRDREKNGEPWSIFDEYDDYGIDLSPANNSVEAGLNRVGEYLKIDPKHKNPITGEMGAPRLYISTNCPNLIREIPEYIWKKVKDQTSNPKEEPKKKDDHACDALRYIVMGQPLPYSKEAQPARLGSFDYILKKRRQGKSFAYIAN